MKFVDKYMHIGLAWYYVLFSNKKINLNELDEYQYYQLKKKSTNSKYFLNRNMGGTSVMVWGSFSLKEKIKLVIMKGHYNLDKYIDLLKTYITPYIDYNFENNGLFQQDNTSICKSKKTMYYLNSQKFGNLYQLPISPNLNSMENVQSLLPRHIYVYSK